MSCDRSPRAAPRDRDRAPAPPLAPTSGGPPNLHDVHRAAPWTARLTPDAPDPRPPPAALAALLTLLACRPPAGELPICPAYVASTRADEADTRVLPARAWLALLLPGLSLPDLQLPDAPRTCSGQPLTPDPRRAGEPLPPRPLAEDDLTFGEGPGGQMLVWARALQFADGSALGPVALVRWVERGLEIRGVGPLHAAARRPRLRLVRLADHTLLVADGDRCPPSAPDECVHEIALAPLVGQRFLAADLLEGDNAGPARLLASEHHERPLADGWVRRVEVWRNVELKGDTAAISEALEVRDCDLRSAPVTCQDQLLARDERPLRLVDGRLVAAPSAYPRLLGDSHD